MYYGFTFALVLVFFRGLWHWPEALRKTNTVGLGHKTNKANTEKKP